MIMALDGSAYCFMISQNILALLHLSKKSLSVFDFIHVASWAVHLSLTTFTQRAGASFRFPPPFLFAEDLAVATAGLQL